MNCSPVSSDLLPEELKNNAVMNPSSLSTLEILQVILKQQELLRKDSAAQYFWIWLCYHSLTMLRQLDDYNKSVITSSLESCWVWCSPSRTDPTTSGPWMGKPALSTFPPAARTHLSCTNISIDPTTQWDGTEKQKTKPVAHWSLPQELLEPVVCCFPWSQ